jgi:2-isopropylmalate synthase
VLISDLAGRSNIVMKARELGFEVTNETPQLREMLKRIKDLEHQGYEFESADGSLALLIRRVLTDAAPPFVVEGYHVAIRGEDDRRICEAIVKVRVGGRLAHTVADGDGPVNALDAALRLALMQFEQFSRRVEQVRLTDYKVRIIDSRSGTAARTRVLIESGDGADEWGTVGVDGNIIEASLQALVDSLEYALVKETLRPATTSVAAGQR